MRYYFHLEGPSGQSLPDAHGVEAGDPHHAYSEAVKAIMEIRHADSEWARDLNGWTLNISDASGTILFSISLDANLR
jgi:hypothetical protein